MARRPPTRRSKVAPTRHKAARAAAARTSTAAPTALAGKPLHVLNGGTVLPLWNKAHIRGTALVHAEMWAHGPVAPDLRAVTEERRAWMRENLPAGDSKQAPDLPGFYQALSSLAAGDEVVLWGEADLFCLVNVLGAVSLVPPEAALVSVVWSPRRVSLLDPDEVKALSAAARRLGPAEQSVLRRLWDDYASRQRDAVEGWLGDPRLEKILPGADALLRLHLARFPSPETGLGADEAFLLGRVVAGDRTLAALMAAVNADERMARYGMGDWEIVLLLRSMASRRKPLLHLEGDPADVANLSARPTIEARPALAGKGRRSVVAGIDRWVGGVHLSDQPSAPKGRR